LKKLLGDKREVVGQWPEFYDSDNEIWIRHNSLLNNTSGRLIEIGLTDDGKDLRQEHLRLKHFTWMPVDKHI
jgi:hypothetical protein